MVAPPPSEPEPQLDLSGFHQLDRERAQRVLLDACSSPRWADQVAADRPYDSTTDLLERSDEVFATFDRADVDAALSGHPRIGERARGAGTDARFSSREQAAVTDSAQDVRDRIREGNVAYEQRFDRVFLVRAAGRSPEEILAELTRRLDNDDETETAEVIEQLRQITTLRLRELIHP